MQIFENGSLRSYNTFGVDSQARYLVLLDNPQDAMALGTDPRFTGLPKLIVGSGSNLLFRYDYPGVVAVVQFKGIEILGEEDKNVYVRSAAGENWHQFVRHTLTLGLGGLENLSLIPGTVGAAPMQNIGAYGVELSDCFESLETIDLRDGRRRTFDKKACCFGYRSSVLKTGEPGCRQLITSVTVRLSRNPRLVTDYSGVRDELERMGAGPVTARRVSEAICRIRRRKLPDPARIGNAGSFFKNPVVSRATLTRLQNEFPDIPVFPLADGTFKLAAAWLIEHCGWKGYRQGDTGVYDRHALVLVNYGNASGADLWHLASVIMASVRERFGVKLEPEPLVL